MNRNFTIQPKAVTYARVSSREQEKEGFSIPAQLKLLNNYAAEQGLRVVGEFVDVETARNTGRPELPVGTYLLEADRQSPKDDRRIPDKLRGQVLRRDVCTCQVCQWNHELWNPADPRHLELHHVQYHSKGGKTESGNLTTLCTICHDDIHRKDP